MFNFNMFRKTF